MLAVALVLFAVERFVLLPDTAPASDSAQEIVATEVQQSIAVLPFVNMSPDPDQEYFSDGLSEEVLNLLAKIPALKVIGRTSSFAFKGKNEDLRVIGQALGVNTLLEGSVRKSGDRVRITAQLINASDGTHIWSDTYDRTLTDIFAVQDDVAAAIIDALQVHVGANPSRGRPTENTEAYTLFLRARVAMNSFGHRVAEAKLLQAIELDPKFAEAYELLAYIYWSQTGWLIKAAEGQQLTGEAATKALAIDPDLVLAQWLYQSAYAFTSLGTIESLERVVREQPANSWAWNALIFQLIYHGYHREALGVAERFVEFDPLSSAAEGVLFEALYSVGRTSEALATLEFDMQLVSDDGVTNWFIGEMNLVDKQDEAAIAHFEATMGGYDLPSNWARDLVTRARDPATGQAYLDHRIPQIVASGPEKAAYDTWWSLTKWYLYLGFLDRYFEIILDFDPTESTWSDADNLVYAGTLYRRLGFTAHPKYLELAEATGMLELWEQRGPPDFCDKVDDNWICE